MSNKASSSPNHGDVEPKVEEESSSLNHGVVEPRPKSRRRRRCPTSAPRGDAEPRSRSRRRRRRPTSASPPAEETAAPLASPTSNDGEEYVTSQQIDQLLETINRRFDDLHKDVEAVRQQRNFQRSESLAEKVRKVAYINIDLENKMKGMAEEIRKLKLEISELRELHRVDFTVPQGISVPPPAWMNQDL